MLDPAFTTALFVMVTLEAFYRKSAVVIVPYPLPKENLKDACKGTDAFQKDK